MELQITEQKKAVRGSQVPQGYIPPRQSLYEIVQDKRENKVTPVARCLMACNFKVDSSRDQKIDEIFQNYIKMAEDVNQNQIYGYLQIRDPYLVQILESDSESINIFLKFLYQESIKEKPIIENFNVLVFNEENPDHCYDSWFYEKILFSGVPVSEVDKTDQQQFQRIFQIYQMFTQNSRKAIERQRFTGVKDQQSYSLQQDCNLTNEDLCMLVQSKNLTLKEYYEMYLEDLEIDLETEHIFPYAPRLTQILEYSQLGTLTELQDQ